MSLKRLFVAVAVPPQIRRELYACKNSIPQEGLSWVREENLHITVLFIGNTPDNELLRMEHTLAQVATHTAFSLQCKQVEAVRRRGKVSMVWAGFEESTPFVQLATKVSEALNHPPDHAPTPHITMARAKRGRHVRLDTSQFPAISHMSWQVQSFGLWESVLTPQGSIYTVLKEWHLQPI